MKLVTKRSLFDEFFDDFLNNNNFQTASRVMKSDIYEEGDSYHLDIELPGFTKEDLKIDFDNGYLTVTAEKKDQRDEENKKYIRKERFYGLYKRSYYIGDVSEDSIRAKFDNGVLKVSIKKIELEAPKQKIISIE
ncbi:MAG TPA: Hsp20/alpha crystallin family protein [Bacilli bacterium]|nr:Hsp20/alpha crystallin family protein [Bacilli bacterium]